MIVTARQLEDLHRQSGGNGHVVLPYRARLSPLAHDWLRAKRVAVGYSDVALDAPAGTTVSGRAQHAGSPDSGLSNGNGGAAPVPDHSSESISSAAFLWWCDGPCGPAKAAIAAQSKESSLRATEIPADAKRLVPVIRTLAAEVKAGRVAGGVLLVQSGAAAVVYANRCPSLRAVLGTCLEAVEQGVQQVAANVLVIEYPHKTLSQVKNMLSRFVRAKRGLSEEANRQLQELASCG